MTENEAIERIKYRMHTVEQIAGGSGMEDLEVAIKALEDVQQYRTIGTPEELQAMKEHGGFTGVELANIAAMQMKLKEYEAIGTQEECRAAIEKQTAISREIIEGNYVCPKCHNLMPYPGYCGCGQRLY